MPNITPPRMLSVWFQPTEGTKVITWERLFMLHELHAQGVSISAIARQTGLDRKTVRRHLAAGIESPVYGPPRGGRATRVVVETRTAPVTECRACGHDLEGIVPTGHERRVQVDIVFETRELTVEAEVKTCPRCRTETRGRFPEDMPGPLQYGHGIVAFATHLLTAQMLSLRRTAQTLAALTGRAVAEATLLAWLTRLHEALAGWETAAIDIALNGNAANMVEKPTQSNPTNQVKGGE